MSLDQDSLETFFTTVAAVSAVGLTVLWVGWMMTIGPVRGSLAALCRGLWLLPLFVSFFPETMTHELPRALSLKPLHVLLDDSASMSGRDKGGDTPAEQASELYAVIEAECARLGCLPKLTRLSEVDADTRQGYTPLSPALEAWIYKIGAEPWALVSDGGDYLPTERWAPSLKGLGAPLPGAKAPRGMIVGFAPRSKDNVWIKDFGVAPFSFEDKPLAIDAVLRRADAASGNERVQLQVLAGEQALATVNAEFRAGETETAATATVPPLPRGQHLLTLRALPTATETALWDNTVHAQVEVMPNTVGVLHLLGSPSWDGRFLRRYLKAEPKYDLISFFILRDPWDSQQVNERELSLIPFPVERLFREELPNFRVVIIQNFTLFQFLLPEYQQNLVKFVQDGGGLLFVGGPRALQSSDLQSSPLRAILPFEVDEDKLGPVPLMGFGDEFAQTSPESDKGPAYDENLAFKVQLAEPDAVKRSLANVYDDWEALAESLTRWKTAKGLHHMERVEFKKDAVTPLLTAKTAQGEVPLAVASYPGKGRAIWVFSDALWRLAMTMSEDTSRETYNRFLHGAMTWLMRQDLKKPLIAKNFRLSGARQKVPTWRVTLQGPAARYYQPGDDWKLTVCGAVLPESKLSQNQTGADEWELTGPMPVQLAGGERCTLNVEGTHAAFGSVKAQITGIFPEVFKDSELDAAPQKLEELAALTGASIVLPPKGGVEDVRLWLEQVTGQEGVALPSRFKTLRNFFWIIDRPWFWALLLLMPLEVVIRRWDQLFAGGRAKTAS
jgi:hypothetical protein